MALDVARAVQDPAILKSFNTVQCTFLHALISHTDVPNSKWAESVISSCSPALLERCQDALHIIDEALKELASSYSLPIAPLVPRPALMLAGHLASALYLLEHATWAYTTGQPDSDTDVEVFKRWVLEGGSLAAIEDARLAKTGTEIRSQLNSSIVFGQFPKAKL